VSVFLDIRFRHLGLAARAVIVVIIVLVSSRFAPDPGMILGLGSVLGAWSCLAPRTDLPLGQA